MWRDVLIIVVGRPSPLWVARFPKLGPDCVITEKTSEQQAGNDPVFIPLRSCLLIRCFEILP